MPPEKIERFKEQYLFDDETAEILVSDKAIANFTEEVISELRAWVEADAGEWKPHQKKLSKLAANWLTSELFKYLRSDNKSIKDTRITPENFAELITLVYEGKVNSSAGQKILELMYRNGGDPSQIMRTQGLEQMDDDGELESVIKEILQDNQAQVEQYKSGKESVLQFFVGQTMKATRGKANPQKVVELLKNLLA
jgi:aspartyl-tRNA(Asn)/glutamyl-tRNA(Gln) amidotransferase subunit B